MKNIKYIIVSLVILSILWACRRTITYPPEPSITFRNFSVFDSVGPLGNKVLVGALVFSFTDGDGDLGLPELDTILPGDTTNSNLFFTLFHMQQGIMVQANKDEIKTPLNYRIPFIPMRGRDKSMKGEIQVLFFYWDFPWDTIQYSFFVVDRAGHKSNTEQTPILILPGI